MTTLAEAVATATATLPRLYDVNAVPKSPDYPYGSQWASFGSGATYTLDGREGVRRGRIVLLVVGHTEVSALDLTERWRYLLVGRFLKVDGYSPAIVTSELDPAVVRDPDLNGLVSVTTTLSITAAKEQP